MRHETQQIIERHERLALGFTYVQPNLPNYLYARRITWRKGDLKMYEDPIVKEVREAGALLAKKSNYDVHKFFEQLRKTQKDHRNRLINKADLHKVEYGITKASTC